MKLREVMHVVWVGVLSVGCGQESGAPSPAAQAAPETTAPVDSQDRDLTASLVETLAQAGECTSDLVGRLVYASQARTFYVCDAAGSWSPIDLRGERGEQGDQGARGEAGRDGRAGQDGATGAAGVAGGPGPTGAAGQAGQDGRDALPQGQWLDVTGKRWVLGRGLSTYAEAVAACPSPYRLPTPTEWRLAYARGIPASQGNAWANDGTAVSNTGVVVANGLAYCIEE